MSFFSDLASLETPVQSVLLDSNVDFTESQCDCTHTTATHSAECLKEVPQVSFSPLDH